MTITFPDLIDLISKALVPAPIAEHVFANQDKMAESFKKDKLYTFTLSTGEIVEIKWTEEGAA